MNAHAEVIDLLAQMREVISRKGPPGRIEELSDSIETLTKSYMEPCDPIEWERYALSRSETRIAAYLAQKIGQVRSKEQIFNATYFDRSDEVDIKIVDVFICKIRKKFKEFNCPFQIETVFGIGYRMGRADEVCLSPHHRAPIGNVARARAHKALEAA